MIDCKMCLLIPIVRTSCINEGEINLLNPQYKGYLNIFTGDQVNITGQVGVCRNGSYDTVCDANWDASDAAVLCRTLIPRKTTIKTILCMCLCLYQNLNETYMFWELLRNPQVL